MAYDKTQQSRIDAGLCKDCGKPRGENGTKIHCRLCATRASERATARKNRLRQEWDAANLCYGCGAPRDNETIQCTACRKRQNERNKGYATVRRQAHMAQGLCKTCGKERYYASNYCRFHFIETIARHFAIPQALYEALLQKLEAANFICFYTGMPIVPGNNACVDHLYSRSQHPEKLSDLDNLVWCDKWINRMKGHMSYQDFISLCQTIVNRATVHV